MSYNCKNEESKSFYENNSLYISKEIQWNFYKIMDQQNNVSIQKYLLDKQRLLK